jgi:hypothetical protein
VCSRLNQHLTLTLFFIFLILLMVFNKKERWES